MCESRPTHMRSIRLICAALCVLWLSACADPQVAGDADPTSPSSATAALGRADAYEALIRYLADPEREPIYVSPRLCFQLMEPDMSCPDHLSPAEQAELSQRLADLGHVRFTSEDGHGPEPGKDEPYQLITLGPVQEKPDGLRVEGGTVCGGLCGTGSVYILVASDDGYTVTGADESYGSWIA